jgi:serine/threonine protein kinase
MTTLSLEAVARALCADAGYTFGGGIAQGAFKETFLATKADGTKLALKILKPGFSPERTDREMDAMKRCSHANIAALIELAVFVNGGSQHIYLVEAFLDGGTLEDRLKKGLLDRDSLIAIGDPLIEAIGHIANHDLVHRDLKPPNIMFMASSASPIIVDFGIVRDLRKDSITLSFVAMGPGTPFFAAPEQLNNDKALIDWRTDQFALGITLALCHFGVHPYAEQGETPVQTINRVAARKGPSVAFQEAIAAANIPVIARMVSPWPADRVRTPELLLEKWRAQRG